MSSESTLALDESLFRRSIRGYQERHPNKEVSTMEYMETIMTQPAIREHAQRRGIDIREEKGDVIFGKAERIIEEMGYTKTDTGYVLKRRSE